MSHHARTNPELYEDAEERAQALSWGRCWAVQHLRSNMEKDPPDRCILDAPHPQELHQDEEGVRW